MRKPLESRVAALEAREPAEEVYWHRAIAEQDESAESIRARLGIGPNDNLIIRRVVDPPAPGEA